MGLLQNLTKMGGRLGILKIVSTTATAPPGRIPTRKLTLKELMTEIRTQQVETLAQCPAELSVDFARLFESAGIKTPPTGWTIQKLIETLRSDACKGLSREETQKAILAEISKDQAHVHDVVADGIARDQALDAFEVFARKKFDERVSLCQSRKAELQAQIHDLQQQIERLDGQAASDKAHWKQWHDHKIQYEKDMAWAIGFLLDKATITVDHDHA